MTIRNLLVTTLILFTGFLLLAKGSSQLIARFEWARADEGFRDILNEMAVEMVGDYPLGVGLGNYAAMGWLKYGAITRAPEPFIVAHNIWYLTLAEVGYAGFFAFALMWVRFYQFVIFGLFRTRKIVQPYAFEVFLGTLAASIPLQMQGLYHFSFRQTSVFYFFFIAMGTAASFYYNQKRLAAIQRLEDRAIASSDRHND